MRAALDHVFLLVPNEAAARQRMERDGLRVNYARVHPGQGTANVCACLDDVFLELLWFDGSPVAAETHRIGLGARADSGSPFGIAWRGDVSIETDAYAAPFLPAGRTIPVARASADTSVPFVFGTPGGVPPIERTDGLPGRRQRPELARLGACTLVLQDPVPIAPAIDAIDGVALERGAPSLRLELLRPDGTRDRAIVWEG